MHPSSSFPGRVMHDPDQSSPAFKLSLDFNSLRESGRLSLSRYPMPPLLKAQRNAEISARLRYNALAQIQLMETDRTDLQTLQFQARLVELSRDDSADLNERLARFCSVAAHTLDVERASIWLFNDKHTEQRCLNLFIRSRNAHESGAVLEVDRYPRYFDTLENCRTIAAEDACTDPATAEFATGYLDTLGIASMLDVPIRSEGRTVGVLCNEHVGSTRDWRADERNFAASLSDLIALACETDRRRQYNQRLRLLRDVDRAILSARSVDEIAEAALARFHELVPCDRASVAIFESARNTATLVGVFASGETRLGIGAEVPPDVF